MSAGKGGGGVSSGYFFSVQSYWPPRVVQRIFLFRRDGAVRGLWMEGSSGVARVVGLVGGWVKNDVWEGG